MNEKKYKQIFYFITLTIIVTIGVQFYWNYKNYQENKRQLVNEIQISFDNSIEEYYAALAKEEYLTIVSSGKYPNFKGLDSMINSAKKIKSITKNNWKSSFSISEIQITSTDDESCFVDTDSLFINITKSLIDKERELNKYADLDRIIIKQEGEGKDDVRVFKGEKSFDSLKRIKELQPIFISFTSEVIIYSKIDSLLKLQFNQKELPLNYSILHLKNDSVFYDSNLNLSKNNNIIKVHSKSTYVNENEKLQLRFINPDFEALKKGMLGILLSLILSLAVVVSLFYLLKIINHQKQLAEVKNDLISNITHEFKTPIATISVALESIKDFNEIEHSKRTNRYLDMSTNQLSKLNEMVEKLLETATLDGDSLLLNREKANISGLLKAIVEKFKTSNPKKDLNFITTSKGIFLSIDLFHFENAINNIIDNAVKYGGNNILIELKPENKNIIINVIDNGTSLENQYKEKLFEQFYRVPKGNIHDVKGFGIGLYYTKKIIEKHNGIIQLELQNKQTVFKITLPND